MADTVSFRNGILDSRSFVHSDGSAAPVPLIPPTPLWFSEAALPYAFDPEAQCPAWLAFLNTVLPAGRHPGAVRLLQEWFGYLLTADTRHQKILVMVGPPRSGKGTIMRALQRMVGECNCASPSFDAIGERFGLEPLAGKRVATIPDAHLGRTADAVRIVDKLLQISGEDAVTVDRKNKSALANVRLGVRFTIGCNEPPDLPDSSGAMLSRRLLLQFGESFLGREDLQLDDRLRAECPGVTAWALRGLRRLRSQGRFTDIGGAGTADLRNDMLRQNAPVQAFVQDCCEIGPPAEFRVVVDTAWRAWQRWAKDSGHNPGTKGRFGRRMAALAGVQRERRKLPGHEKQSWVYEGIRLAADEPPGAGGPDPEVVDYL